MKSEQNCIGKLSSNHIYRYAASIILCAALTASACTATPSTPADEVSAPQVQEAMQITASQNQPAPLNQSSEAASAKSNAEIPAQPLPAQASQLNIQADTFTQSPPADLSLQSAPTELPQAAAAAPVSAGDLSPSEPKVGFLAPDLTLTALDGSAINLSDLRGKNVLVNYWVTWCVPCMDELPALQQLSQDYQGQNIVILTVNGIEQDELGKVQQLVADLGLTTTVMLDENESFWKTYLVQFLPTSFFIDTQGVIRHIMLGSGTEDTIRLKIDQLIANQL